MKQTIMAAWHHRVNVNLREVSVAGSQRARILSLQRAELAADPAGTYCQRCMPTRVSIQSTTEAPQTLATKHDESTGQHCFCTEDLFSTSVQRNQLAPTRRQLQQRQPEPMTL